MGTNAWGQTTTDVVKGPYHVAPCYDRGKEAQIVSRSGHIIGKYFSKTAANIRCREMNGRDAAEEFSSRAGEE